MFGGSEAAERAEFLGGRGDRRRLACGGREEKKKNRERESRGEKEKRGKRPVEEERVFQEEKGGSFSLRGGAREGEGETELL